MTVFISYPLFCFGCIVYYYLLVFPNKVVFKEAQHQFVCWSNWGNCYISALS